jgi:hypothetical protein
MKKKISISVGIAVVLFFVFQGVQKYAMSYDGASPTGHAGDPASGNSNCTACHGGTATAVTGWITSNIPGSGYVPGTTYTITVTSTGTGGNKGFQISPQSTSGAFLGTLIAGTGSGLVGSNHYIHSTGTGITTNPKVWTFTWTAPATGLGPVTFYGAFAIGTGTTHTSTYTVTESSVGINETSATSGFSIYPNPVKDKLTINYSLTSASKVQVNLYSLDGKKIASLGEKDQASGSYKELFSIKNIVTKGIYFIELKINDKSTLEKMVVE